MGLRLEELRPLLTVEEASQLLGISRGQGYRAAAAGDLPTLRWGRRLYVPTARLLRVIGLERETDEERAG